MLMLHEPADEDHHRHEMHNRVPNKICEWAEPRAFSEVVVGVGTRCTVLRGTAVCEGATVGAGHGSV